MNGSSRKCPAAADAAIRSPHTVPAEPLAMHLVTDLHEALGDGGFIGKRFGAMKPTRRGEEVELAENVPSSTTHHRPGTLDVAMRQASIGDANATLFLWV